MADNQQAAANVKEMTKNSLLTGTVLVAGASAFAYGIAFVYEKSFCDFFSIPTSVITVDLATVLAVAATLVAGAWTLIFYSHSLYILCAGLPSHVNHGLRRVSLPIGFLLIYLVLAKPAGTELLVILTGATLILLFEFVLPLVTQRKTKGYWEKLDAQDKLEASVDTLFDWLGRTFGLSFPLVIVGLTFLFYVASLAGTGRARSQQEFYLVESVPELVVLRIYGDRLICVPVHKEAKEVDPVFTIISLTDSNQVQPLKLRLAKIGPLKLSHGGAIPEQ